MVDQNNIPQRNEHDLTISSIEYPKYGFEVDGIEELDVKFKCIFCLLIIQDPIQLITCGHRSCRGCLEVRAATVADGNVICPLDDCHEISNKNQV